VLIRFRYFRRRGPRTSPCFRTRKKAIEAAISAGVIHSIKELIDSAIAHLPKSPATTRAAKAADLMEHFEPVRDLLSDEEIYVAFRRYPDPTRRIKSLGSRI
jgi:hypothetical protein